MSRIQFSLPWPITTDETRDVFSFAFRTSLVAYLAFFLLEKLRPGFVTFFYNLDTILLVTVVTGVISSVWPVIAPVSIELAQKPTKRDFAWMGLLTIATVVIVWYRMGAIGWLVSAIAPLCGLIVLGLSLLVYYDRDDATQASR